METNLPLRIAYSLNEIEELWNVSRGDLHQWLQQGVLRTHLWMPMLSLYQIDEEQQGNRVLQTKKLCHREGYLEVFPHDCRLLLTEGAISVREFEGEAAGTHYRLPETHPSYPVRYDDLVILADERSHFEEAYQLGRKRSSPTKLSEANDARKNAFHRPDRASRFRKVLFENHVHSFGVIQATVIALLYEANFNMNPWMNGKQLLFQAGSASFSISNVFKRKPNWRRMIESDGLGNYRLHPSFAETIRNSNRQQ